MHELHALPVDLCKVLWRACVSHGRAQSANHTTNNDEQILSTRSESNGRRGKRSKPKKKEQRANARDEHDIPLSLLESSLVEPLKVHDLLLELLPAHLSGHIQLCHGRHASSRFADARERRGRDELAQEVAARRASRTEDESRFRGFFKFSSASARVYDLNRGPKKKKATTYRTLTLMLFVDDGCWSDATADVDSL
jgi:hypothetical protein